MNSPFLAAPGLQVIIGIACNVSNHIEPFAPSCQPGAQLGPRGGLVYHLVDNWESWNVNRQSASIGTAIYIHTHVYNSSCYRLRRLDFNRGKRTRVYRGDGRGPERGLSFGIDSGEIRFQNARPCVSAVENQLRYSRRSRRSAKLIHRPLVATLIPPFRSNGIGGAAIWLIG